MMENIGALLGQISACVLIGVAIEGILALIYDCIKWLSRAFNKNSIKMKPVKFKRSSSYYIVQIGKYLIIGLSLYLVSKLVDSFGNPVIPLITVVLCGSLIYFFYRILSRMKKRLIAQQTINSGVSE